MIDTHCHLTDPRLLEQLEPVLTRAAAAGVSQIVTVGTDPADWNASLKLSKSRTNVRCAVGGHPNNCHEFQFEELQRLREFAADSAVVALGEMGLDYHHKFSPRQKQAKYFEAQLHIATEVGLPVVIHCREAMDDCLAILSSFPTVKAVFHCFTGTSDEAKRVWNAGYLTGFTGVVTFRNGQSLRDIVAMAPADQILLETDAPYLTPEPMRKLKTNEPAMVVHTAAVVATARNMSMTDLDKLAAANAMRFYRWGGRRD